MSSPTTQASPTAQPFPPVRRLPTSFLSLAPKTSAKHLKTEQPALTVEALAELPSKPSEAEMKRRTSSLSSTGSKNGFRFLRLGHVQHGDENKGDFFEVAVEE